MSSRRQAVDKLDRTITRLYTYLSGSEGEDTEPNASTSLNHHHRSSGDLLLTSFHPITQFNSNYSILNFKYLFNLINIQY